MGRNLNEIVAAVFAVEAKDEQAAALYRHCGFQAFPTAANHYFMPIQDIRRMFPGIRPARNSSALD